MSRGKVKGSQFERDLCRKLSLWWTNGERDDVFWRTSSSGGRSTIRSKKGKKTFGQYGDIQATDPIGQPLLDLLTIEAKRGYNKATPWDLLDGSETGSVQWRKFIKQAQTDAQNAKTPFWVVIHQRDRRKAIIAMPYSLHQALFSIPQEPYAQFFFYEEIENVYATTLNDFLSRISPWDIKCAYRKCFRKKVVLRRKEND